MPAGHSGAQEEMYAYPEELGQPDFDDFSDTRVVSSAHADTRRAPPRDRSDFEPPPPAYSGQEPGYAPEQTHVYAPVHASEQASGHAPEQAQSDLPSWQDFYEPEPEVPEEVTSALEAISALDALESELDTSEEYDVDKMLRDYGFEDDDKNSL